MFWLSGNVTMSKASLEQVIMPEPGETIEHLDYTFETMHTYSDLDYTYFVGKAGYSYMFRPNLKWTADVAYYDLTDDAGGNVYGDESGSYFMVRTGLKIELF